MALLTITSKTFDNWNFTETSPKLRATPSREFIAVNNSGVEVLVGGNEYYLEWAITLGTRVDGTGKVITTYTFPDMEIYSTTDAIGFTGAHYRFTLHDSFGNLLAVFDGFDRVALPPFTGNTTDWESIYTFNHPQAPILIDRETLSREQIVSLIAENSGSVSSVFGRTGIVTAQANDYTWAQINKTTSSLADITTRSHTLLSDIGANTHAQIDSHIASITNPHAVTKAQVGLGNVQNIDTTNASNISTGTLADGRLSSNVPLKNAASNIFTGSAQFKEATLTDIAANGAILKLIDTTSTVPTFVGGTNVFGVLSLNYHPRLATIPDTTKTGVAIVLGSGSGTSQIEFYTSTTNNSLGSLRWQIKDGNFIAGTDNSVDIGASGATRPRTGYFATSLVSPEFNHSATVKNLFGTGSPEGVVTAGVSSTYRRTDGGTGTAFYVKESGVGNTGWVAVGAGGGSGDMILASVQTVTGAKTFNPTKLIIGEQAAPPTVVANSFWVDSDDGKLYFGKRDASAWLEVFLSDLSGPISVPNGGTGVATLTGLVKGNGTAAFSAATAGTDYVVPTPTVNAQTGTTYTLQASDNGKIVTLNNAAAITVTVPSGLGAGFNVMLIQLGAGQVTLSPSSTTIRHRQSHTKIAGQYGIVSLVAFIANDLALGGDTAA